MDIGIKLRTIRKNNKLTLKQLGELVGLSEQAIGQYERGDRNPSIEILNKIAAALGVSVNELIKDDTIESSVNKLNYLEQYIKTLGYEIDGDASEGYLVINTPEGTYEITEDDITDLTNTTKSFILFKLQEIIKHSRKIGK